MIEIRLNGYRMTDKVTTHEYLKEKLSLPEYYGNNLDALWDCLSTDFSQKKINIYYSDKIIENLGSYGKLIIKLFREISRENGSIEVNIY
ncbi:MAG: barstar family protein [Candidatus Caldatribacteriota bacterium]|jgi:ribonuclease inhibitor|nr:barstar family protein [Atribacterota bacterium]MDD3640780.1 barstar family protein [Atribacterota bacterium]MDD4289157.1 barstar family protein [Atribacterota bacterium]MDD4765191.1 barstar family protein [Atribacterota bacterium]MDI9596544.1 barstar family protein [Atribacterota bacterium]